MQVQGSGWNNDKTVSLCKYKAVDETKQLAYASTRHWVIQRQFSKSMQVQGSGWNKDKFLKFMWNFAFLKNSQLVQRREPTQARIWIFLDSLKRAFHTSLPSQVLHLFMYEWSTTHNQYFNKVSPFIFKFYKIRLGHFWYEAVHLNCICIVQLKSILSK